MKNPDSNNLSSEMVHLGSGSCFNEEGVFSLKESSQTICALSDVVETYRILRKDIYSCFNQDVIKTIQDNYVLKQ